MDEKLFRIGVLARKTGLTNRTLRYYDQIGLLKPATRSTSGYRLYGRKQVERLHKIRSLKYIGLELDEIRRCIDDPDYKLENILYRQMKQVRTEIELGRELYRRLKKLAAMLSDSENVSSEQLIRSLDTMNRYEKYYTAKQLEYLEDRKKEIGTERMKKVQQEWKELIEEVREEMNRGSDPDSRRMQQLAARWQALIREFTGGNSGIRESLANMYRNEKAGEVSRGTLDESIMQYIGRAISGKESDSTSDNNSTG